MRLLGGICAASLMLIAAGCGDREAEPKAKVAPKLDPYLGWPADTIDKPSEAGAVEQTVHRENGDAEPMRVASRFLLPDWTQQIEPLTYKSPKNSRMEVHYLQRGEQLRKADDAKLEKLIAGEKDANAYLVIARPWRGWYSEANSISGDKRIRVYLLFQPDRQLELHLEWNKQSPKAYEEAQAMASQVIFSIEDLEKSAEG